MRHAVAFISLALFASPASAQVSVLLQPASADDDRAEEVEKAVRSRVEDAPGFSVVSQKDVKRQLDALNLEPEDLEDDLWRGLAGRLEADFLFRVAANGETRSVSAIDLGGGEVFALEAANANDVAAAVVGELESLVGYYRALLFCDDYSKAGQHSDALRNCEEAVEAFPESATALVMLGTTLMRAGRCAEAVTLIERAAAKSEGIGPADLDLVQARECAGDTEGALEGGLAFVSAEDSLALARTLGQAPSSIESEYDRFDDETKYFTPWYVARLDPDLRYRAQIACAGTERCSPLSVQLLFTSQSGDWEFLRDRRLVILAGEDRIEIAELEWIGEARGPGVSEFLGGSLTVPQAVSIGNSAKAEARLGGREFTIAEGARLGFALLVEGN